MVSKKCKYAIKALIYLAKNQTRDSAIFSSEIAFEDDIPKKFLETILRDLRNSRILQSQRGKTGGYRLLKQPEHIYLSEVMRLMDGPIALLPCVSLNYYAPCEGCNETLCKLKTVFESVRDETLSVLGNTSIKDLI